MREARILLVAGDLSAATRWMQESGLSVADERCWPIRRYIFLAHVLLAREQFGECLELVARLSSIARASGAMGYVIELAILQALALWARGRQERGAVCLTYALSLAEPEGYVRSFIDHGAAIKPLLHRVIVRGIRVAYAGRLLEALDRDLVRRREPGLTAQALLVEPLSERELEVLHFLPTHLTSAEIAAALTISPNTVRTHIKHIYGKFGVHSRTEAVRQAEELGLL
jgi:LuxR family maltose regulon positive regulatory protein